MRKIEKIVCPVCRAPLYQEGGSLYCSGERKHCFDVAKSGYVNLQKPGKMSNATAGDDGGMVKARRDFLKTGLYDGISDGAADALKKHAGEVPAFIDAGCGEGYHTNRIYDRLCAQYGIGFDASKHAADRASKMRGERNLFFAAGNIFSMPVEDGAADAVFSLFAPVAPEEFSRVLNDEGYLLVCSSGENHLLEMRKIIYDEVRISPALSSVPDGFELVGREENSYMVNVGGEDLKNLFLMTPFSYRTPEKGREKLYSTDKLDITVQVQYSIYRKKKD